jgi:uncharacterized protein (TIGR03435 family)
VRVCRRGQDRPVGRYDFTLSWTADDLRYTGGVTDEFPDFFTAIEQQLGLKQKTVTEPVDVLVIDRVEGQLQINV